MPREFEERGIFFADVVENPDRSIAFTMETDDAASGAAELPLQRLHAADRRVEVLLEKLRKDFHRWRSES